MTTYCERTDDHACGADFHCCPAEAERDIEAQEGDLLGHDFQSTDGPGVATCCTRCGLWVGKWRGIEPCPTPPADAPEQQDDEVGCTCPSGDGSLRWPCATHPSHGDAVEFMATELLRRLRQTAIGHKELISAALVTARAQGAHAEGLRKGAEFDRGHTAGLADALASRRPAVEQQDDEVVRELGVWLRTTFFWGINHRREDEAAAALLDSEPMRRLLASRRPAVSEPTGDTEALRARLIALADGFAIAGRPPMLGDFDRDVVAAYADVARQIRAVLDGER